MNTTLILRNRQRARSVDTRHLRRIVRSLLRDDLLVEDYELGVHLVGERAMVRLNESHLRHAGCTDVITFDYQHCEPRGPLLGDIFVCVPEAWRQAARFRVAWQQEVLRYVVHGILHLRGFDDQAAGRRKAMKKEENRLLRRLGGRFDVAQIGLKGTARSSQYQARREND